MEKKTKHRSVILLICDILATVAALPIAYKSREDVFSFFGDFLRGNVHPVMRAWPEYIWFCLVGVVVIIAFFLYNSELKPIYRFRSLYSQFSPVAEEILFTAFILGFASFCLRLDISRSFTLLYLAYMFLLMIGCRILFVLYFKLMKGTRNGHRRILVVGNSAGIFEIGAKITQFEDLGYTLLGYVTDLDSTRARAGEKILGPTARFQELLEARVVDEVVFVGSEKEDLEIFERIALQCEELGILTRLSLDFFPHSISRTSLDFIENQPFLRFSPVPEQVLALMIKRMIDIVGAIVGLIVSVPLLFIPISILIKLTSKGPVVYKQIRCGLYGREFTLYKFRSMIDGAEDVLWEIKHLNEMSGPTFKMRADPRVTRWGRILRKTSLDELPQFYNVLKGEMSLVGPRAPLPEEVSEYSRWQRRRLSVKPGLTCLWQVSGRNEIEFHEWMKLDLKYIDNWSLWLDFKILLLTIPTVIFGRGAR